MRILVISSGKHLGMSRLVKIVEQLEEGSVVTVVDDAISIEKTFNPPPTLILKSANKESAPPRFRPPALRKRNKCLTHR